MKPNEMSIALAKKVNGWNDRDWDRVKKLFNEQDHEADFQEFAWDLALNEIRMEQA